MTIPSSRVSGAIARRVLALLALTLVYGATKLLAMAGRLFVPVRRGRRRIIINGTFHNPNWFFAHIEPLVRSGYGEVILVCDEPVAPLPNLTYACPPAWANRLLTRAGAKALWTLMTGIRHPADIYVGYHIFPSAVTALVCARLLGGRAIYQVTSGPLELDGGGWHAENRLLVALGGPSAWAEYLALSVTREFDLAVVRGSRARDYLRGKGHRGRLEVITGSVAIDPDLMGNERPIDIALVGRLAEYKRPDRFLEVMARVARLRPDCRAVIIGDGPDRPALEARARALGLEENLEFLGQRDDVPTLVGQAKCFVLTSRWEGVSIAMLEAMGVGAVPVVSDVGDLRDFAIDDVSGYVVAEQDIDGFADHLVRLLAEPALRRRLSEAGREMILERCERAALARRWGRIVASLAAPEAGSDDVADNAAS